MRFTLLLRLGSCVTSDITQALPLFHPARALLGSCVTSDITQAITAFRSSISALGSCVTSDITQAPNWMKGKWTGLGSCVTSDIIQARKWCQLAILMLGNCVAFRKRIPIQKYRYSVVEWGFPFYNGCCSQIFIATSYARQMTLLRLPTERQSPTR